MKNLTPRILLVTVSSLSTLAVLTACTAAGQESESFQIGTANEGGTYYYLGTAFAQEIRDDTGLAADSVATAGGTENVRRVASGDLDLAFASIDDYLRVMEDEGRTGGELQILGTGHLTIQQPVVTSSSGIGTLEEMNQPGNRISVGEPGSAIQLFSALSLGAHGMQPDDLEAFEVSLTSATEEMKNGQLDGAYMAGGAPLAAITDLMTGGDFQVLPTDQKTLDYWDENTAVVETEIPAGTYDGQEEALPAAGSPTLLLVSSDMPEERAYEIIRVFHENGPEMGDVHPAAEEYTIENAFRDAEFIVGEAGLQYHPGAIKWYEENDSWIGK
ncbi:TAXI family TRAP transporter solute-binding subunit [Microbacterium sp. A93]|uniref:TAXI family TRAP transporter solute-binding subunit n=1 Tax=Microbacterium sp. A93 TaxID=3450716 RepID=UPI003F43B488